MSRDDIIPYDPSAQQQRGALPGRQPDAPAQEERDPAHGDYSLTRRIDRLVQGVLEGRIVPFLGAGISMYAPPRRGRKDTAPTLKAVDIAEQLSSALHGKIPSGDHHELPFPTKHLVNQALQTTGHSQGDNPTERNRLSTSVISVGRDNTPPSPIPLQLGEVAELCWAILGPAKTCAVLRLEDWNQRLPMAAHHYLAMLVREGLVAEVLETNYDDFVEEAVLETFGSERRKYASTPEKKRPVDAAPVIHDLDSYRKHIAQPQRPLEHEALVKVIKLNGCATAYRENIGGDSDPDKTAKKIILTEEQLQNWGEKAWAQDLLRDRVRSRALLFIGFGNQDPIVRHHAVAVIREFSFNESPRDGQWFKMENAPFVMAYEKTLSFFQFQILRAFRTAHEKASSERTLDNVATVYMNAFLGRDGKEIDGAQTNEALPADIFLRRVAGLAICRHVSSVYFGDESDVHSYLRGTLRQPGVLLQDIKRTLLHGDVVEPPLFDGWLRLVQESHTDQKSSAWADVCFAIRGDDAGRAGYRPFLDAPVKHPMLLALVSLLATGNTTIPLPDAQELRARCNLNGVPIAGFRLLNADAKQGRCSLYATSHLDAFIDDAASERPVEPSSDGDRKKRDVPNNAVVLLLGRGAQGPFRMRRWIPVGDHDEVKSLREVIAIGDLFALRGESVGTVSMAQARQNLERLSQEPEVLLGSDQHWQQYCVEER